MKKTWLERKKAALCFLLMAAVISAALLALGAGKYRRPPETGLQVSVKHYGVDAAEIERSITVPMEDAVSAIPGLRRITSTSRNGQARIYAEFEPDKKSRYYDALRDAVDRVYRNLPPSVQRPEIISASADRVPVWSAAVFLSGENNDEADLARLLERELKPRLEAVPGAGEVEISGAGMREIAAALDAEKSAALGLSPAEAAVFLAANDALFPAGRIAGVPAVVDARYQTSDDLGGAFVPSRPGITLAAIADIGERQRPPDIFSRLDGKPAAGLSVTAASGARLSSLSADIKREIEKAEKDFPVQFHVLADRGADEAKAFRSVLAAAIEGALAVSVLTLFMSGRTARCASVFAAVSVPFICLASAAVLPLAGFPLDKPVLAGIAAGAGAAVDAVIILSRTLLPCREPAQAALALKRLAPPLFSGSATTLAALVPIALANPGGDFVSLALGSGAVTLAALIAALTLLPPLFFDAGKPAVLPPRPPRRVLSLMLRSSRIAERRPLLFVIPALVILIFGVIAVAAAGFDSGGAPDSSPLYAHVEFDGGFAAREADVLLGGFAGKLETIPGVKSVQTTARDGSGSAIISFDPKKIKTGTLAEKIRSIGVPGAFVYFPETDAKQRNWRISVYGDDSAVCKKIAREAARICGASALVNETVLNFKDGGPRADLRPDRERLAGAGISFAQTADVLRRAVHGPVAYKRLSRGGEIDVRVMAVPAKAAGRGEITQAAALRVPVVTEAGTLPLSSLVKIERGVEETSIEREGRRRTASFSIRTKAADARRVRDTVMPLFGKLEKPRGCTIEFDRDAITAAENYSSLALYFLLALIFCAMVIAASAESFAAPCVVLPAAPVSLAFPALFLFAAGRPFNEAAACAFVAVSGIAVNAAVLAFDCLKEDGRRGVYRALRGRAGVLAATAATTAAGSLPFLFSGDALSENLALVSVFGVAASFVLSFTFVPALFTLMKSHSTLKGKLV